MITHITKQDDTLDLIVYLYYLPTDNTQFSLCLTALLAANPGACQTPVFDAGVSIELPAVALPQAETKQVNLWD